MAWGYLALAGVQLVNGYNQAENIRESGRLQQSIAEMNAGFQELDAWNAMADGYTRAARYDAVAEQTLANQSVAYAAQNVDINYGSAAQVRRDSKIAATSNVLQLRRSGAAQALGLKLSAISTRMQGSSAYAQASSNAAATVSEGILKAGQSVTGYFDRVNSTGTGLGSKSGTNSTPQWGSGGGDSLYGEKMSAIDSDGEWRNMSFEGNKYWVPHYG